MTMHHCDNTSSSTNLTPVQTELMLCDKKSYKGGHLGILLLSNFHYVNENLFGSLFVSLYIYCSLKYSFAQSLILTFIQNILNAFIAGTYE